MTHSEVDPRMKITLVAPNGSITHYPAIRAISSGGKDKELVLLKMDVNAAPIRIEPNRWVRGEFERELVEEGG